MKKILLILILVLMAAPVYAFTSAIQGVIGGSVAAGGASCQFTPYLDTFSAATDVFNATATADVHYGGMPSYTPAEDKTICKAEFKITCKYDQCSTTTYYAAIYTKSGNNLDSVVGEVSSSVPGDNAWDTTTVTFTFPGVSYPQVTTSGTYAIVVYSNPVGDGSGTSMTSIFMDAGASANGGFAQYGTDKLREDYGAPRVQLRLYTYE